MAKKLAAQGIKLMAQGIDESSRTRLLESFRRGSRVALFGTNAFWEGIDVVGDALSVLVIAKLPFSVPSDPVFAARSEGFEDPFLQYSVPQAILKPVCIGKIWNALLCTTFHSFGQERIVRREITTGDL